jgi:quercetin dioxygenase-like cupin family protein
LNRTKIDVQSVADAVEKDKLTAQDVFKRTYIGHGKQSSVFVFQGHKGPFKKHVHVTHDEIGYVLKGTGKVMVGDRVQEVREGDIWVIPANTPHGGEFQTEPTQVLFVSSPIDDPENPDRVWLD